MNEPTQRKILSLMGLAQKAGVVASGEVACEQAIRDGSAKAVVLSADATEGTTKKFSNRCFYYEVPLVRLGCNKEAVGHAIGKGYRSCAAICEAGFAEKILSLTETK